MIEISASLLKLCTGHIFVLLLLNMFLGNTCLLYLLDTSAKHSLLPSLQAFLARIEKDHGSFDLDWLRYVPRENAKYDYIHKTYITGYDFTILLYSC
jgi:hypothetical protein